MEARIQKWGNSDGIKIPSNILKSLSLKTNDKVDLQYKDDKISISKSQKVKISLAQKFANYQGENLAAYFTWDELQGKEIW